MTELSHAAQQVYDSYWGEGYFEASELPSRLAAVLRAIDEELASCLYVGSDEGDIKRVIDVSDLHDLIDELEAQ